MDIQNTIENVSTFQEFLPLAEEAKSRISWFGARSVCISTTNEIDYIDCLAQKMMELHEKNPDFPETDRPLVRRLTRLIDQIYDRNDEQVAASNCITRILTWIRDFWNSRFPHGSYSKTRWAWRECSQINCLGDVTIPDLYTKVQCERVFGFDPSNVDPSSVSHSRGTTLGGTKRWSLNAISHIQDRVVRAPITNAHHENQPIITVSPRAITQEPTTIASHIKTYFLVGLEHLGLYVPRYGIDQL